MQQTLNPIFKSGYQDKPLPDSVGGARPIKMKKTGVKVKEDDLNKLKQIAYNIWIPGQPIIIFSVGERIARDKATLNAKKICHQLALDYGLPEIPGYYGITNDGEFVESE